MEKIDFSIRWFVDVQRRKVTRLDGQRIEREPLPSTCSVQLYETAPALTLEVGDPSLAALTAASGSGLRLTE